MAGVVVVLLGWYNKQGLVGHSEGFMQNGSKSVVVKFPDKVGPTTCFPIMFATCSFEDCAPPCEVICVDLWYVVRSISCLPIVRFEYEGFHSELNLM